MVFGISFLFYPKITVGRVIWNVAVGTVLGLLMIAGHKRQEIHLDENTMTQIFPNIRRGNRFVIPREKIVSIKERVKPGPLSIPGLFIKYEGAIGKVPGHVIIPAGLPEYQEVRAQLADWHSIQTVSRFF